MRVYLIWLSGVVAWNYGSPRVPPIADVVAAIALSVISINLRRIFK